MAKIEYDGNPQDFLRLADEGYEFKFNHYLSRGWELFKEYPWGFIGFTFVYMAILMTAGMIPFGSVLVAGPLAAGFYLVAHKIATGEKYEFGEFFSGFDFFLQLLLVNVVVGFFVIFGFIALIIPGIYLAIAYQLAIPFIIFGKLEFWDAMDVSRKIITKNWWSFFGLSIVVGLIGFFGTIFTLFLGLFVVIPWASLVMYAVYEDIVGKDDPMFRKIDEIGEDEEVVENISKEFLPPEFSQN